MFWTPEAYEGCGVKSRPICVTENCGQGTDSRGLCKACFKAWRRYGKEGLERRAARLAAGDKQVRVSKTPRDARNRLREAAILFAHVDADNDAAYKTADEFLWKVAIACGVATGCVKKAYHVRYKERWIAEHGIEAWRARIAASQRTYKAKKAKESLDTPGG